MKFHRDNKLKNISQRFLNIIKFTLKNFPDYKKTAGLINVFIFHIKYFIFTSLIKQT